MQSQSSRILKIQPSELHAGDLINIETHSHVLGPCQFLTHCETNEDHVIFVLFEGRVREWSYIRRLDNIRVLASIEDAL